MEKKTEIKKWRLRLFEILEVGHDLDAFSRGYDFIGAFAIVVNLAVSIMNTYDELRSKYGAVFLNLEAITVVFFD